MVTGQETPALSASASPEQLRARIADLEGTIESLESRLSAYDRVFFQNPVPAIVYDASSLEIIEANEEAVGLYGYDRAQLCSVNLMDLFGPAALKDDADLKRQFSKPINALGPLIQQTAAEGELVIRIVLFALDWNGVDARIAMLQDETGRYLAEEALRSSEERLSELFENANDVIFLQDLKGKILAINRAAEYLTGYSRTEVLGQEFALLIAPEAHEQIQDSIRAHLGGSPTQHYELPIVSKLGKRRSLEVSTRIIYRKGYPVAIQGIGRDITERKQSQQRLLDFAHQLQITNDELSTALRFAREATQLKEQFLANTSHELRTPMNGIIGMVDLLKDTPLNPEQFEYVEAVSECADDLLTIINDLLDVSRMEAGRLTLMEEPFDVEDSLNAVMKMLRLRASAKGLLLTYDIEPRLPKRIFGDSVRFRQVLMNLIANAVKFTPVGKVHIRLSLSTDGEKLYCEVVDSGIGVEEAIRERIFEAFFQADGTLRRRFGGTGLGLTISKQLVEIMGGRIGTHNNDPAAGATFWFDLPLRTGELLQQAQLSTQGTGSQ